MYANFAGYLLVSRAIVAERLYAPGAVGFKHALESFEASARYNASRKRPRIED